ncbi:MAG: nitroreductase family protein [Clostridia bacterium]
MLKSLVEKNRSYRGFDKDVAISTETLKSLLENARLVPSGRNKQAIRYILSNKKELNDKIFAETNWAMALKKKVPFKGEEPTAYIVMCIDSQVCSNKNTADVDVGIAAQTILLSATEIGLGGCMIGAFNSESLEKSIDIPKRYMSRLIIALGKPIEKIVLTDVVDGETGYFRDENNVHYVPKRLLNDTIISV